MGYVGSVAKSLANGLCGHNGAVAKLSANGLVGTGFASWYWLQPRAGF